jgi:RNase H-fold protein (predicted Holliday junction resolvase)
MNYNMTKFLGFDPGKDKCGIAIMDREKTLMFHQVVPSYEAISTISKLAQEFQVQQVILGDQTTAKKWKQELEKSGWSADKIIMVDERYSSLEARDRYWEMYPPKGLSRLIPQGMRQPPRPVDDIVAIILIERYLTKIGHNDSQK